MSSSKHKARIVVDGVELTVEQTATEIGRYMKVTRVVGRDRKRKLDVTSGTETRIDEPLELVRVLKQVAARQTARCTCDYRRGYSDHAEHCQSIYVARYDEEFDDD